MLHSYVPLYCTVITYPYSYYVVQKCIAAICCAVLHSHHTKQLYSFFPLPNAAKLWYTVMSDCTTI